MGVNENAGLLNKPGAYTSIASKLAPTGSGYAPESRRSFKQ